MFISKTDKRIQDIEINYDLEHPTSKQDLLAQREHQLFEVEEYRQIHNIHPYMGAQANAGQVPDTKSMMEKVTDGIIDLLLKPYFWIFASIAICSPYAVNVIQAIVQAFSK